MVGELARTQVSPHPSQHQTSDAELRNPLLGHALECRLVERELNDLALTIQLSSRLIQSVGFAVFGIVVGFDNSAITLHFTPPTLIPHPQNC
jgi:hypothetical protein